MTRPKGNIISRSKVEVKSNSEIKKQNKLDDKLELIVRLVTEKPRTQAQLIALVKVRVRSMAYYLSYLLAQELIQKKFCDCCSVGILYEIKK